MMKRFLILAAVLASVGAGPATKPAGPRASADKQPLPDAIDVKATFPVPLSKVNLGSPPEAYGPKLYSASKSADLLKRRIRVALPQKWFAITPAGEVVGLGLTDGRVTKIQIVYPTEQSYFAAKKKAAGACAVDDGSGWFGGKLKDQPVQVSLNIPSITLEVDPVEWHISTREVAPEVAAAMRAHKPAKGMSMAAAKLVFGDPESTEDAEGSVSLRWEFYEPVAVIGTREDAMRAALRGAAGGGARHRGRLSRVVTATFESDKITAFSDRPR